MAKKFKIDSDIPFMSPNRIIPVLPFEEMKVGDSIYFKHGDLQVANLQMYLGQSARMWVLKNQNGRKFSSRGDVKGVRLWRIK